MDVKNAIKEIIKKKGYITFHDYMDFCLYHPISGYYRKSENFIGKDFTTSPHTGPLFGFLIAVQLIDFLTISDVKFNVIEIGAGHGFLANDILHFIKKYVPDLYSELNYIIIEPSDKSRIVQKRQLIKHIEKVSFYSSVMDLKDIEGIVLSNELLDAFPVHLIEKEKEFFKEAVVLLKNDNFCLDFISIDKNSKLFEYIDQRIPKNLPNKYRTEVNLNIKQWINNLSVILKKGFILTIDYGHSSKEYFAPFRNRGTLMCYRQHNINDDFFAEPGKQDITAHVNFSDLKDWGVDSGFKLEGYTNQWAFLGSLDFEDTCLKLYKKIDPFSPALASIKSLIMPHGMGSTHKVMIQSKNIKTKSNIKGLKLRNMKDRL